MEISSAAGDVERRLDRGEPVDDAVKETERVLTPVIARLAEHLGVDAAAQDDAAEATRFPAVTLPPWVDELRRFLADGDVAAQLLWNERGEELKSVLPAKCYAEVRGAIERFDFDAALAALTPAGAAT